MPKHRFRSGCDRTKSRLQLKLQRRRSHRPVLLDGSTYVMSSRMTQSQCGNLMGGVGSWFELSCPYFCLGLFVPCYHNHFGLSGFNCLQTAFFLIMWLMCQSSHCDIVFQLQTFLSHGTVQSVDLPVNHRRDGTSIIAGSYSSVGFEKKHYVKILRSSRI